MGEAEDFGGGETDGVSLATGAGCDGSLWGVGGATAAAGLGQAKSSARPARPEGGSPLTRTLEAFGSAAGACAGPAPKSSSWAPGAAVSGTTGPATGRAGDCVP